MRSNKVGLVRRSATAGREGGFTLFEMLVVIMIIVIVAGGAVAMLNIFFRGQGIRQGAVYVTQAFTRAKELSATQRKVHFLVFKSDPKTGAVVETHVDGNGNHQYDKADIDKLLEAENLYLPDGVDFASTPGWVGIEPNGYCVFKPGYQEVSAGVFEGDIVNGIASGDIILKMSNAHTPYKMCMDIERCSGKIRKTHFLGE